MNAAPSSFASMSDDEVIAETHRLVACERMATAALLRSLGEIDLRRLYLREGCSSLFTYCTQVLHLGEAAAYNRIEGARIGRRVPALLVAIEDGSLTLTTVRLLAPLVTDENCADLIGRARHKSRREIEELVAALAPKPRAATIVRRISAPEQSATSIGTMQPSHGPVGPSAAMPATGDAARPALLSSSPARQLTPLSTEHYRLQVTLTREAHGKLRRAQDLLRHTIPSGDLGTLLDRALTLLVEDLERRRCAAVAAPRQSRGDSDDGSRSIPSAVRRAVWKRDGGRCAFVGTAGRCRETGWLEFHHVRPFADRGAASVENIQLQCRAHNQFEARLWFETGAEQIRESRGRYGDRRVEAANAIEVVPERVDCTAAGPHAQPSGRTPGAVEGARTRARARRSGPLTARTAG